jgi:4-amino-4-deoxy-L-arabinose transferase-like glycosyltransferase
MSRRDYLIVFAVALAARLPFAIGILVAPDRAIQGDSDRYWMLGGSLLKHQTLGLAEEEHPWDGFRAVRVENGTAPDRDGNGLIPEGIRTPGYPLFVAGCRSVWDSPAAVVIGQVLLGGVTACLVAAAVLAFAGSRRGALVAGLLWALHPGTVAYDSTVMSDGLFSFTVALTFFLAARARTGRAFLIAAAAAGLAALVRPFGVFLVIPVAVLALARADRRWRTTAAVCVVAVLPTVAWCARNAAKGEGFRLCTVGDVTMYYYFAHYVRAEVRGEDGHATWSAGFPVRTAALRERVQPGEDCHAVAGRMAREEIAAAGPKPVARVLAKSQLKLWTSHSLGDALRPFGIEYKPSGLAAVFVLNEPGRPAFGPQTVLALLWVALNVFLLGWMFVSVVRLIRRRQWAIVLACGGMILLSSAAAMSNGIERYRLPLLVPGFVLIGATLARGKERPANRELLSV